MHKVMTARECIETLNQRSASVFLILFLCGDLVFVVLHFVNALIPGLGNPLFSIEQDRGYPEIYQYLKFFWIIALLIHVSWKSRSLRYFAWTLVFIYFLFDDALQLHERVGGLIAANLNFMPPLGLRLQDFGELAVTAIAGICLLFPLIWAYKRGSQNFRKVSQDITLLILVLVFFGVVVDMAHIAISLGREVKFILGVIEDGGEMLSVSLVLWYTFLLDVRDDNAGCYLCDLVRIVLTRRSN
jgi:hypothetical protein